MNEPQRPLPTIEIITAPRYVVGFPMLMAVTLSNPHSDAHLLSLPELGLWQPLDSLSVQLLRPGGELALRLGPQFQRAERPLFRTDLRPGESKRMLVDLTQFGASWPTGHFELRAAVHVLARLGAASAPVAIELIAADSPQRAMAARLRKASLAPGPDSGSWQRFLTHHWASAIGETGLAPPADQQVALHLALHRLAYSPVPLAQASPEGLRGLAGSPFEPEADAFEYELIVARGAGADPHAARARLLQRTPALRWWLDKVDAGQGPLASLRLGYGHDRPGPRPQGVTPYPS